MDYERELMQSMKRQEKLMEQMAKDFHWLCGSLGGLAERLEKNAAEDDDIVEMPEVGSTLKLPEFAK